MASLLKKSKSSKRHYIKHNYHDHSQATPSITNEYTFEAFSGIKIRRRTCNPAVRFPLQLHKILENAEADGISDVLSWKVHGRAFSVNNLKGFSEEVMPRYFNQTKTKSFFRQLNLYGFLRITQGYDEGAYYHELFLRGKPFLASKILRQKVKGTKVKGFPSPETEPNFYSMPYVMDTSSLPAITISDDLPKRVSSVISFHENKRGNYHKHSKEISILSCDDDECIDEKSSNWSQAKCRDFLDYESDSFTLITGKSPFQDVMSACSFFDGEDVCTMLEDPEEVADSDNAISNMASENKCATDDFFSLDDPFDYSVQYYSLQECIVLCNLLGDTSK
jgi:hypothetical protein